MIDLLESFEAKHEPEPMSGCWLWTAHSDPVGYGKFWNGSKVVLAHRWSYERFVALIPAGLVIDHLCRNASCVNPDHMEPVTQRENVLRGTAPAAIQAKQTHCIRGHPLFGENLYTNPNGRRQCKTCRRAIDMRRNKRRRNANR